MNLLICTQKVDINDSVLGFFHDWIQEFAKHVEKLTVICLEKGEYSFPENVKVFSLGKEKSDPRSTKNDPRTTRRLQYIIKFYKLVWRTRKNYDTIFVHMNSEYIVLGGWLWKLMGKRITLWYTHKSIPWQLRVAEKLVNIIFTASKDSFRLKSEKVKIMGHGIDLSKFLVTNEENRIYSKLKSPPYEGGARRAGDVKSPLKRGGAAGDWVCNIITIGRISPSKNYETLIKAVEILVSKNINVNVKIIGGPIYKSDKEYLKNLKKLVNEKKLSKHIEFVGPVPNKDIAQHYFEADLFAHMSQTGSLDKAILEAMASGIPVISCNDSAVNDVLTDYKDILTFKLGDINGMEERIRAVMSMENEKKRKLGEELREIVVKKHGLENLIKNLVNNL